MQQSSTLTSKMTEQNSIRKILHLTNTIRRGGKERQMFTIYKNSPGTIKNNIVSIHQSNSSYLDEYEVKDEDICFLQTTNNLTRVWRFRKIAERDKPDVVYAWDTLSFLIAVFAGFFLPYQIINGSIRHGVRSHNFSQYWRTFILHLSRNVVANSNAGLKANNLKRGSVLYNGVNPDFFKARKDRPQLTDKQISLVRPVYISVANLVPYKDYFTVIAALAELHQQGNDFTYLILGEGSSREAIHQQIIDNGLEDKVHLLGAKSNVLDYLHNADIFIHSSKGEGVSNAILEAMFCGLPVIATNVGGVPETVYPGSSILFPYKNVELLHKALIDMKELYKTFDPNNVAYQQHLEKFHVDTMIDRYVEIIKSL